jgi:hypothetical protein
LDGYQNFKKRRFAIEKYGAYVIRGQGTLAGAETAG